MDSSRDPLIINTILLCSTIKNINSIIQFSKKHADKYLVYTLDALHACI
jgi:hypothetical protein